MKKLIFVLGGLWIDFASGQFCTYQYEPVCAANGKTYANECTARTDNQTKFTEGRCGVNDNDRVIESRLENSLLETDPVSACGSYYIPVCANNGKTYTNVCKASEAGETVSYRGRCFVDQKAVESEVTCLDRYLPVCGHDGTTYRNSCKAKELGVTDYRIGICKSVIKRETPVNLCRNSFGSFEKCTPELLKCDVRSIATSYDLSCKK